MGTTAIARQAAISIFELAKNGYSNTEIAAMKGIGVDEVIDVLRASIAQARHLDPVVLDTILPLELERLDTLTRRLLPYTARRKKKVVAGITEDGEIIYDEEIEPPSTQHTNSLLSVMKMRADLLGLQAPSKSINVKVDWAKLSKEQMSRIAAGEDIAKVLESASPTTVTVISAEDPNEPVSVVLPADHPIAQQLVDVEPDTTPPLRAVPIPYYKNPAKLFTMTREPGLKFRIKTLADSRKRERE